LVVAYFLDHPVYRLQLK